MAFLKNVKIARQKVIDGESESVLFDLLTVIENEKKFNIHKHTVELLIGDLKEIKSWENSGQLTYEESRKYKNQLNARLLSLLDELSDKRKLTRNKRKKVLLISLVVSLLTSSLVYLYWENSIHRALSIYVTPVDVTYRELPPLKENTENKEQSLESSNRDEALSPNPSSPKLSQSSVGKLRDILEENVSALVVDEFNSDYPILEILIQNHSSKQIVITGFELEVTEVELDVDPVLSFQFYLSKDNLNNSVLILRANNTGWEDVINLSGEIVDTELSSVLGNKPQFFSSKFVKGSADIYSSYQPPNFKFNQSKQFKIEFTYQNINGERFWNTKNVGISRPEEINIVNPTQGQIVRGGFKPSDSEPIKFGVKQTSLPDNLSNGNTNYKLQKIIPPISTINLNVQISAQKSCRALVRVILKTLDGDVKTKPYNLRFFAPKGVSPYYAPGELISSLDDNISISNSTSRIISLLEQGKDHEAVEVCGILWERANYDERYKEARNIIGKIISKRKVSNSASNSQFERDTKDDIKMLINKVKFILSKVE